MQATARLAAQLVAVAPVAMAPVAVVEILQLVRQLKVAIVLPAATTAGQGEAVVVWAPPNGIARIDLPSGAHTAVSHQVRSCFCLAAHLSSRKLLR